MLVPPFVIDTHHYRINCNKSVKLLSDTDDDNIKQSDDYVQYLHTKPTASVCTRPSKYLQIFANEIKINFDLVGFDLLGQ